MASLNRRIVFGAYVLGEGQEDYWLVTYAIKMRFAWLEPPSRSGAHMAFDALSAVPQFVDIGKMN